MLLHRQKEVHAIFNFSSPTFYLNAKFIVLGDCMFYHLQIYVPCRCNSPENVKSNWVFGIGNLLTSLDVVSCGNFIASQAPALHFKMYALFHMKENQLVWPTCWKHVLILYFIKEFSTAISFLLLLLFTQSARVANHIVFIILRN